MDSYSCGFLASALHACCAARDAVRRLKLVGSIAAATIALLVAPAPAQAQETITIGIGIQSTTTNTVNGGVVIQQLKLLDKHLPRTGRYAGVTYKVNWQNFTSGPPVTNGMVANNLQIGMMGDFPLVVNGATFQTGKDQVRTQLIATLAYNINGSGNGLVVHRDSPYFDLADLKGKRVSVPFGSAAHGMLLRAMRDRGWSENFWELSSQSPEIGATSIQEKRVDGHANFVPFAELMPYRGFARKIFDGVETKFPTMHGVIVRTDFAEKYPEVVVAYLKALIEANDWIRRNPVQASQRIEEWTKIEKEVAYMFLGPSGLHTLDPTLKPKVLTALTGAHETLVAQGRLKQFSLEQFVNDRYIRQAFQEMGLDYDKQLASFGNTEIGGTDPLCGAPIKDPRMGGEVWLEGGALTAYSSTLCTLAAIRAADAKKQAVGVAFVFDRTFGLKLFASAAFYSVTAKSPRQPEIVPFLLRRDAEQHAAKTGGKLASYAEALAVATLK
jgi:NitT/TauT family transport system substrate-binding protein